MKLEEKLKSENEYYLLSQIKHVKDLLENYYIRKKIKKREQRAINSLLFRFRGKI